MSPDAENRPGNIQDRHHYPHLPQLKINTETIHVMLIGTVLLVHVVMKNNKFKMADGGVSHRFKMAVLKEMTRQTLMKNGCKMTGFRFKLVIENSQNSIALRLFSSTLTQTQNPNGSHMKQTTSRSFSAGNQKMKPFTKILSKTKVSL